MAPSKKRKKIEAEVHNSMSGFDETSTRKRREWVIAAIQLQERTDQ